MNQSKVTLSFGVGKGEDGSVVVVVVLRMAAMLLFFLQNAGLTFTVQAYAPYSVSYDVKWTASRPVSRHGHQRQRYRWDNPITLHNKNIHPHLFNVHDDWRSDTIVVDTLPLDEETVQNCLAEFVESDYGTEMFGRHEKAARVGITGTIEFVELCGPHVTLTLRGQFWHRRSFVLGRAAMWLNARIPEITDVVVADMEELQDFEEIIDDITGEILFRKDKRSEDFNGDRATMEYQGLDPDMRGPFPASALGGGAGNSMINPM
jgi:hypothetical protein